MLTADTLAELKAAVGDGAWLDAHEDLSAYTVDFRRLYRGVTPLVLLPRSVDQVSRVLTVCNRERVGVVPQGGNTGYCGGATPDESGSQIVLSMRKLLSPDSTRPSASTTSRPSTRSRIMP